ncbi:hypothetical protein [Nonomuraea rosea]
MQEQRKTHDAAHDDTSDYAAPVQRPLGPWQGFRLLLGVYLMLGVELD